MKLKRKQRQTARAVTQGAEIRISVIDDEGRSTYRSMGFVGAGIPVIREALARMYEIYGKSLSEGNFQGYLRTFSDLTDEEIFEGIDESVKRYTGDGIPAPGFIHKIALETCRADSQPLSPDVAERKRIARSLVGLPRGRRNPTICRAWDDAKLSLPGDWYASHSVSTWFASYKLPDLRRRIDSMISKFLR